MSQRMDAPWGPLEVGNYEQTAPEVFSSIRHEDLMVAAGSRGAIYFFSPRGPCCYRVQGGIPLQCTL